MARRINVTEDDIEWSKSQEATEEGDNTIAWGISFRGRVMAGAMTHVIKKELNRDVKCYYMWGKENERLRDHESPFLLKIEISNHRKLYTSEHQPNEWGGLPFTFTILGLPARVKIHA